VLCHRPRQRAAGVNATGTIILLLFQVLWHPSRKRTAGVNATGTMVFLFQVLCH